MGQDPPPPPGPLDLGALRTPRGGLLGVELALSVLVVGLVTPIVPHTLPPTLLHTLGGALALGGQLLRHPPRLPHGYGPCLAFLRPLSGSILFLLVALVALASSRDPLASAAFTFGLLLALLFAFDAFAAFRACSPGGGGEEDSEPTP